MTATAARKRNAVEWVAFGLGTALTIGIAAFLAWDAIQGHGAVDLRIAVASVQESAAGADVTMRVHNAGDAAAQEVDVEACDGADSCVPFTFAQVPAGGVVERVVRFDSASGPYAGHVLGWRTGG